MEKLKKPVKKGILYPLLKLDKITMRKLLMNLLIAPQFNYYHLVCICFNRSLSNEVNRFVKDVCALFIVSMNHSLIIC